MKNISISEKIKEYRYRNRLTQEDFGKLLGVSAQAISKWERKECYPDITLLPDVAELLSCSVNDFFE
ncbi:MAG: helix-turn-helix domain-containing protein [Clostridia bacterium]|nr:helix-turn-helix domain-containing protein [Clostridia bacterium]